MEAEWAPEKQLYSKCPKSKVLFKHLPAANLQPGPGMVMTMKKQMVMEGNGNDLLYATIAAFFYSDWGEMPTVWTTGIKVTLDSRRPRNYQLSKNPNVHYRIYKTPPFYSDTSLFSPIHKFTLNFFMIQINLTL
jgi:hypothetical protein